MQVAGILAVMLVAYIIFRDEFSWPASLTWSQLPDRLDSFQNWLLEQRTAANRNFVFAIFDGFRALAEWLVTRAQRRDAVDDLGGHLRRSGADRAGASAAGAPR